MCTVTFVPVKGGFCITSSRDEKAQRSHAIAPKLQQWGNTRLVFPKDRDAGGSWIAIKDHANAAVLLNGSFHKNIIPVAAVKSRGLILLDIIAAQNALRFFLTLELNGVNPFTIILLQDSLLYECRWDGLKKYCKNLSTCKRYIWSSNSLYSDPARIKRELWFRRWFCGNANPTAKDAFYFHRYAGDGDGHNDMLMNRDGNIMTVSITSLLLTASATGVTYFDLKKGTLHKEELINTNVPFPVPLASNILSAGF